MRALWLLALGSAAGCTLIFNGDDLHGSAGDGGSTGGDGGGVPGLCAAGDAGVAGGLKLALAMPMGFAAGDGANDLVRLDLDGDGIPDLATSNGVGNDVTVSWGSGPLAYGVPQHFATSAGPVAIAAGDVDGDGKPDLIVVAWDESPTVPLYKMSVLLNAGGRMFKPHADYDTAKRPFALKLADVDNDHHLDAIVADNGVGHISVLKGKGDGTFAFRTDFATCPSCLAMMTDSNPISLDVGDLNGDGFVDVVAANEGSSDVGVMLNDRTGRFLPAGVANYPAGRVPHWVTLTDLNGDGQLDLATAGRDSNDVNVLLNKGDGKFPSAPTAYDVGTFMAMGMPALKNPEVVLAHDVNLDGVPDLVVGLGNSNTVGVFLGRGAGVFDTMLSLEAPAGGATDSLVTSMLITDFDGDCRPDVAVVNNRQGGGTVSLLRNQSTRP